LAEQSLPHRQPRRSPAIGKLERVTAETVGTPSQAEALHQAKDTVRLSVPTGRVVVDLSDPLLLAGVQHALSQMTRPVVECVQNTVLQLTRPVVECVQNDLEEWRSRTQRILLPLTHLVVEYRQSALQALEPLRDFLLGLRRRYRRGSFIGDVLLLLITENSDEDRYQSARRLAKKHLTWHFVYGATPGLQRRWEQVRPAFGAYCREHGLSHAQGWEQLVTPIVCDLVLHLARELPLDEMRRYLARELRKEIERELLGRTADQHDPLDRLGVAEDVPDDLVDARLEAWLLLQRLDPVDQALLVDVFLRERSYSELADQIGVSEKTIRRRVANALQSLRAGWPS
jgi:DNA-directed RNA polymerase specialized sigma24 family protein